MTASPCNGIGDINCDGTINVADITACELVIAGINPSTGEAPPTADQIRRADVNGDGVVDLEDVGLIEQFILEVISTFPACSLPPNLDQMRLLEGALDNLAAYLMSHIGTKVTELNTRYPDLVLVNPVRWYLGNLPSALPEQPSICIQAPGWSPIAQRKGSIHGAFNLNLFVFVGHADEETRWRRLCRYMLGLIEMCHTGESIIGYKVRVASKVDISDALDPPLFLQSIYLPIIMEQIENF